MPTTTDPVGRSGTIDDRVACLDLPQWTSVGRMRVFTNAPEPVSPSRGLIIGSVASRELPFPALNDVDIPAGPPLEAFGLLCAKAWGDFVALTSGSDGTAYLMRAPMSRLTCYYMEGDGWVAVASDVDLLRRAGLLQNIIDWSYVAEHLYAPHFRPARTALLGVSELLSGECLILGRNGITPVMLWSPWQETHGDDRQGDADASARALRATIRASVKTAARPYPKVLLGVSGGLDSSIVAACLATAGHDFDLLTLVTEDPRGDERSYARALAAHLGLPLVERADLPDTIDLTRSDAAHLPRPVARSFAQSGDRIMLQVARQTGADAFFSGGGGDNVFCYLQSASPIADRFLSGQWAGALRTASDIARLSRSSLLLAISLGFRRAYLRRRRFLWPTSPHYLSPEALALAGGTRVHPWLAVPAGGLPGKAGHIASLIAIENHLEGFGREQHHPMISPLLAFPVVAACLRIPSWAWCSDGINRAPARKAFEDLLPGMILRRTSKGTPDGLSASLFDRSRPVLRELLLDGTLAAQGLLRTSELERDLRDGMPLLGDRYSRILALADAEAWSRAQQVAAAGR